MSQISSRGNGSGGSGIQTIAGDTGSITGTNVTIFANNGNILSNAGKTVLFENSGTVSQLKVTDSNSNTLIGFNMGVGAISGINNTGLGIGFNSLSSGNRNTALGVGIAASLTSGSDNIFIGFSPASNLVSGGNNIIIGADQAGDAYTSNESNNILIDNLGVVGDNNTIRIGNVSEQTRNFQAGITGVTVASSAPVAIASTGQLSSLGFGTAGQVLTSNGAGTSPTWQAAGAGGTTPLFVAYMSGNATNVTGDGTQYQIINDTALLNVGLCLDTTTGQFTAPASGYLLFTGLITAIITNPLETQMYITLDVAGNQHQIVTNNGYAITGNGFIGIPWSFMTPITAADPVKIEISVTGGSLDVIIAGTQQYSYWTCTQLA